MTRALVKTPRIEPGPLALGPRQAVFARASGARLRQENRVRSPAP